VITPSQRDTLQPGYRPDAPLTIHVRGGRTGAKMKSLLSLAMLAGVSVHAHAETLLHPIVTASRIAQSADQTMAAVSVITRADIVRSQAQSTSELLRERIPGLDFVTTGGVGHQVSTLLRGTSSDQFLFMIDGNVVGSATTGSAAIELIPLEHIERIEVLRGPRSSLYGSEAVGGVIQIFTRDVDNTTASITTGGLHTAATSAATHFGDDNSALTLSFQHYQTRGFDVTNDSEADADGYRNDSVNLRFKQQLDAHSSFFANALYANGNTEFDNDTFGNESDSIQQNYQLGMEQAINADWNSRVEIGQSADRLDTVRNSEDFFMPGLINNETTLFLTKRDQLHWLNQLEFGDSAQASFGIDYINDRVAGTTPYSETERSNRAAYGLVQDKFDRHQLQMALRLDDNEAFGSHTTGNLAWAYDISGDQRVRVSYGTAFIAPSFNDLYFVDAFFNGNPDLNPETSYTTEIAYTRNHGWGHWALTGYRTLIDDLIVLNNSFDSVENADSARIDGIETELVINADDWLLDLNLALIDPVNNDSGLILQSRARQTFKLGITREYATDTIGMHLLAQDSRFANASNSVELAGYAIVNLTASHTINKHWQLRSRLENLFDKEYSTSIDFFGNTTNNTPVALFVTLHYQH
jgi:vitamin B12 transporter